MLSLEEMTVVTRDGILINTPQDVIHYDNPVINLLMQKKLEGVSLAEVNGGYGFTYNFEYDKPVMAMYDGSTLPAASYVEKLKHASDTWKFGTVSTVLTYKDMLANRGDNELVSLMTTEINALKKTYKESVYDQMFITSVGNNYNSMYDMFKAGTWGGLTRAGTRETPGSGENYWLMPYKITSSSLANNLKTLIRGIRYAQKFGRGKPDVLFVNDDTFDILFELAYNKTGFMTDLKTTRYIELGFEGMSFDGIPIVVEPLIPALEVWAVNFSYCAFVPHPNEDFKMDERGWHFVSENSMDKTVRFNTVGNFVCTNPGAQSLITLAAA